MKLKTFFGSMFIFISTYCLSQEIRVEAGLNISSIQNNNDSTMNAVLVNDNRLTLNLGGSIIFPLSSHFSLETGLIFNGKGNKYVAIDSVTGNSSKAEFVTAIYYLDVPLRIKVHSHRTIQNKWFITSGPYVGFGLYGNRKKLMDGEESSSIIQFGPDLDRFDIGLSSGIGIGSNRIQIIGYYDISLNNQQNAYKYRLIRISLSVKL